MARDETPFAGLVHTMMDMAVTVGLIDSISERWPEDVQEQWRQWIDDTTELCDSRMQEAQTFASSHD